MNWDPIKILDAGLNETPVGQFFCGAALVTSIARAPGETRAIVVDAGHRRAAGLCCLEMRGYECWAVRIRFNDFGREYVRASGGFYLAPAISYDARTREIYAVPHLIAAGRVC